MAKFEQSRDKNRIVDNLCVRVAYVLLALISTVKSIFIPAQIFFCYMKNGANFCCQICVYYVLNNYAQFF